MPSPSPVPPCSSCGGTGWILQTVEGRKVARSCSCREGVLQSERLAAAEIPERYRSCNFDNFSDTNASLMKAKNLAREFVDTYPAVDAGLLLLGPSGRGKTHLACAILSELVAKKGVTGIYGDFSDLLMKIQTSFRPDADLSKESILQPYAEAEVLVLDELGASKPHPWVLDVLYNLLNTRYNRKRITIVTSNFEDEPDKDSGERDRLEDRVGSRIRSRLFEMCLMVTMRGDDFRRTVVQGQIRSRF
ncbi:MAG TPA: ATP-binding protein [Thermoanaerobaculia bacterium]|nr:ATP-binding protein [Thermoanaerobaculia bacterium]